MDFIWMIDFDGFSWILMDFDFLWMDFDGMIWILIFLWILVE